MDLISIASTTNSKTTYHHTRFFVSSIDNSTHCRIPVLFYIPYQRDSILTLRKLWLPKESCTVCLRTVQLPMARNTSKDPKLSAKPLTKVPKIGTRTRSSMFSLSHKFFFLQGGVIRQS